MRLTENFVLREFEKSATADRLGIDNGVPGELLGNAFRMAEWLQVLRSRLVNRYGRSMPIIISSGYRGEELNDEVGGSKSSAHCFSLAADIKVRGLTTGELFDFIRSEMKDIGYDQVINEYGDWVHVGLSEFRKRMEDLLAVKENGRTVYKKA